jgi:RNA polymerase sigma-70 factor (ECF subfamily)
MRASDFTLRIQGMTELMYRVCYSQLSNPGDREEAVQECIGRAWEKLDTLRDERHFQTWVVRILINICHDIQRRNARVEPIGDGLLSRHADVRRAPCDETRELHDALLALEEGLRLPVVLHYMGGFSTREIARACECQAKFSSVG